MTRRRTRWLVVGGLAAIIAGLLAYLFWPRPMPVDVAVVHRGPVTEVVSDQGMARPRQTYVVSAPINGRLERLPLEVGDRVTGAKTVLAWIRPTAASFLDPRARAQAEATVVAARAALDAARAQRDRLDADLSQARRDLQRSHELMAAGGTSQQALETAQFGADERSKSVAAADAEIRARQADVAAAESALTGPDAPARQSITVLAPASGVVTRVLQQSERPVTAGTPIVEIADNALEAAIEFLSEDAVKMRPGQRAFIYDWGGPADIPAEVRRIEPQGFTKVSALGVEEQRTLVYLRFTGGPATWEGLAPGYRVWGRVQLRDVPDAILVPLGALVRDRGEWAVYRLEQGRARLRRVRLGIMTDREAEVTTGLSDGDRVIVYPSDLVQDGLAVQPRDSF